MEQKKNLADIGIIGEEADKLMNEDGVIDYSVLGQILKDRETKAASAKELEILNSTPTPQGGQGSTEENEPADVLNAKKLDFGNKAEDKAIKDYYVI